MTKILFAIPTSSTQIERDFGVSGIMLTTQRSSLMPFNVEMCAFLNRNRAYVDIALCLAIPVDRVINYITANMQEDLDAEDKFIDPLDDLPECFSTASLDMEDSWFVP